MRKLLSISFILVLTQMFLEAQSKIDSTFGFIPKSFIVAADNLNFRNGPSREATVIGTLTNGELVDYVAIVPPDGGSFRYKGYYNNLWIKIKRQTTNEIGYVFGPYIQPKNTAYFSNQECDRLNLSTWYGVQELNGTCYLSLINPQIAKESGMSAIQDTHNTKLFLGLSEELETGPINGRLFTDGRSSIRIGEEKSVFSTSSHKFDLQMSGQYIHKEGRIEKASESLHFVTFTNENKLISSQNLLEQFTQMGTYGFQFYFIGDINLDGTPELVISENNGKIMTVYFFLSDKNGFLELQSATVQGPGC